MKTGIFLRLYELNITDDRLNVDFFKEHSLILNTHKQVIIGKAGAGFQKAKIDSLNEYIKKNGSISLFLHSSKKRKTYKATVINISDKLPNEEDLYPKYYNELSKMKLAFTANELMEIDQKMLTKVYLASNNRNILDVIQSCRTACMIVEFE